MNSYISILRGINVSGHNMIKMEALRKLYMGLGLADVQSYIQSGNLVFNSKETQPIKLGDKISSSIKKEFGFNVPVMVMELNEMKMIAKNNPFAHDKSKDQSVLHISFLSEDPEKASVEKIAREFYLPDEFHWKGRAVYLYCPGGYGRTKLNNGFFETKLKLTSTTRNWKTVNELISMAEQISK
jgi:uncharacterized protein (DUF1697 family)